MCSETIKRDLDALLSFNDVKLIKHPGGYNFGEIHAEGLVFICDWMTPEEAIYQAVIFFHREAAKRESKNG